jgi:hypothetical protein
VDYRTLYGRKLQHLLVSDVARSAVLAGLFFAVLIVSIVFVWICVAVQTSSFSRLDQQLAQIAHICTPYSLKFSSHLLENTDASIYAV